MEEPAQEVCQFGKTKYDSRIFDTIYKVWSNSDGSTILAAYWLGDLKSFRVDVPLSIIKGLLDGKQIGALCCNYDWVEVDYKTKSRIQDDWMLKMIHEQPSKLLPSLMECTKLAATLPNKSLKELQDNSLALQDWLGRVV